jgi:drug/metabolite transporter (DMT)-like permease
MSLLILVSLIWAFSFGLIKRHLVGLDSAFISAARLGLALLVFAPLLRLRGISLRTALTLTGLGGVQFGVMYLAYNASFQFLRAYEVALLTITTPILVTLLADGLDRTLRPRALAAALLAVAGTALVVWRSVDVKVTLAGVALVQLSNAAFAFGQVFYRRLRLSDATLRDREVFGLLYAGGFIVALVALLAHGRPAVPSAQQAWTLLYLGVLASGVGFFLWNVGATRVSAGTLAVMNNAKVPLAVAVALLVFREVANVPALLGSFILLGAAVWLAEKVKGKA